MIHVQPPPTSREQAIARVREIRRRLGLEHKQFRIAYDAPIGPRRPNQFEYALPAWDVAPMPKDIRWMLKFVALRYDVPAEAIRSPRKYAKLSLARAVFCWLAFHETSRSLTQIGEFIRKDHTSVQYAVRRVDRLVAEGWAL